MIKFLEKEEDFIELTKEKCLVDFYADWCGPCRMLGEVLDELVLENKEFTVIKVNTDKFSKIALDMGVMSIPALFLMENSKVIKKSVGYKSLDELKDFIK